MAIHGRNLLLGVTAALALLTCHTHGFSVVPSSHSSRVHQLKTNRSSNLLTMKQSNTSGNDERRRLLPLKKLRKWVVPATLGVVSVTSPLLSTFRPRAAWASAPVMVPTRQEHIDPETEAMFDNNKRIEKQNAKEHEAFQQKAREIAAQKGEGARRQYEQQWEAQRQEKAKIKKEGLEKLKRELLDQGLDPFCDPEANRQIIEYEKGIDLAQVPGTKYYMEQDFEKNQPKRSMKYQKAPNRFIIKCMVQDMKNKGKDPLEYFESHQSQTADILNMSFQKATLLAQQYKTNMEQYGQLTVPKDGEKVTPIDDELSEDVQKQQTKAAQAKAKAEKKAAKQKEKEERKAEKQRQKEEKQRQKALAKQQKAQAKENEKHDLKTAALAGASAVADTAAKGVDAVTGTHIYEEKQQELQEEPAAPEMTKAEKRAEAKRQKQEARNKKKAAAAAAASAAGAAAKAGVDAASTGVDAVTGSQESSPEMVEGTAISEDTSSTSVATSEKSGFPVGKAAGAVVTLGGGAFVVKTLKEKADRDEEMRQREFKLIMGLSEEDGLPDEPRLDVDKTPEIGDKGDDMDLDDPDFMDKKIAIEEVPIPEPKKRRGFKSMFGKRKGSDRETDLTVLVSEGATAPDFALLLSKLLTFGAPGRFPRVKALPGDMPMAEFELEAAKTMLEEAAASNEITSEQGAEIFANVVNCMLIDIVDLASSALKEDDKVLVDAINVVVDYMNHAASLYDSVAEGVVITPVTYGGELGKGKLEQMFSKYAASGMMSMDEDFNARVGLLQDVFSISEKKAEGLMMKAMQKNMMKMLKTGEGMEGMEEMMKAMGGDMGGLDGLMGGMDGEDGPSPEQLKEMLQTLKTMKDSGTIPPDELEAVRDQFRQAFGSSIDDVVSDAEAEGDALNASDKELLDLMKEILED